jgi:protein TonB
MSSFTSNRNLGISTKALSLLASLFLHAAVLATAALLIGETGTGPAESSSTLRVSVERIEPTDKSLKENSAPEISEQKPEQHETVKLEPKEIVKQSQPEPQPLKIKIVPTKTLGQQQPQTKQTQNLNSGSKPTSDKKGAKATEKKPMQVAKVGNYSRLSRDYQSRLQRLVERNKYYPLQARRNGVQGKATVSFTVRRDGKIERIVLSRSSGRSILDQAAITTIKRIGKAPPFPNDIKRTTWRFSMPISYNLR